MAVLAACEWGAHEWGTVERTDTTLMGNRWDWCRCKNCGHPGFRVNDSKVVRSWQPCDAESA